MKCLKCGNIKDFIVLGNQNFKVRFKNNHPVKIGGENFDISDIYPVVCEKCQSQDVDFQYPEIKELYRLLDSR